MTRQLFQLAIKAVKTSTDALRIMNIWYYDNLQVRKALPPADLRLHWRDRGWKFKVEINEISEFVLTQKYRRRKSTIKQKTNRK